MEIKQLIFKTSCTKDYKGESEIRTHGTIKVHLISSQTQSTTLPSLRIAKKFDN